LSKSGLRRNAEEESGGGEEGERRGGVAGQAFVVCHEAVEGLFGAFAVEG
jgi:hypothetical protein